MWQKEKKDSSIVSLALLLALASPTVTLFVPDCVQARSAADDPSFPLPQTVESGSTVRIDGSSSMTGINQSLKENFEKQFSGTKVEVAANGTEEALKALQDGKIDLAAINRGLTPEEKAQGLEQLRVRREKIAIVVDEDNPFKGNLTSKQFARIFRGEITDWSQLGGSKGKIRVIDRPQISDTREAFRDYPVFKTANFATGSTATQLADDNTAEIIKQLGKDGISYVLANQVSKLQGVRVLKLHNILPNDSRYPFSQPFVYVYKKNPSLGTAGFLGFASAKPGQQAIEQARTAEATAIAASVLQTIPTSANAEGVSQPAATTSPGAETATNATAANGTSSSNGELVPATGSNQSAASADSQGISPWWWLLALAFVGLLWWLLGKRRSPSEATDNALPSSSESLEEARPTAAQGASVAPPVSEAVSDNPLLRAYAQTQSGSVENTTPTTSNLAQGVTNAASNVAEGETSSVTNITSGDSAALAGGAAASAVAGADLWSATSDRETRIEAADNTTNDGEYTESLSENVPAVASDVAPVTEVTTPQQPDIPTVASDVLPTAEVTPDLTEEQPIQSNWVEDITPASGATEALESETSLWSRLTGSGSQLETTDETTQINDIEEDVWDIETPPTEVTSPQLQDVLTIEAVATEVTSPEQVDILVIVSDVETPPTEVTSPQLQDAFTIEAPATEVTSPEQSNIPVIASDVEAPTTEVTSPEQADILVIASDVEALATEVTASVPEQQDVPELASDEDDWDTELTADATEEQPPAQSNWLDNITSAGGAGLAAGGGATLWSRLTGRGSQPEATDETPQISDVDEDVWDIETPATEVTASVTEQQDVPEPASNVEAATTEVTAFVPEQQDVPELASDEDDWDMEFAADVTEEQPPAQSNWLENITSVGGAGLAAGAGATLWSRLTGRGSQPEATDETTEINDVDEDFWDIETPPTEAVTSVSEPPDVPTVATNAELPTVEAIPAMPELADVPTVATNAELPTVEIISAMPELADVPTVVTNAELPTVEVIPAMPELADIPEAALDVVADAAEPTAEETEEDLSAESNWEENITLTGDAALTSPESGATASAQVTDAMLELPTEPIAEQTEELPQAVSTSTEDIPETVSNLPEQTKAAPQPENVTEASPAAVAGAAAASWAAIYGIEENADLNVKASTANMIENAEANTDVESSIAIAPRTEKWAYVSWNVSDTQKKAMRQQGGSHLTLRLYDVTDINLNQTPTLVQQYECEEITHDRYVAIPASDRDYMTEIGYLTDGDRWLLLARSANVHVLSRQEQDFWFEADAELIIHGATQPGATVTIGGHPIKLKPDGTFHLRVPFKDRLIDYLMTAITTDGQQTRTIHKKFNQENQES